MVDILNTGIKFARNVQRYTFGSNTLSLLPSILSGIRKKNKGVVIYFIDSFFKTKNNILSMLSINKLIASKPLN